MCDLGELGSFVCHFSCESCIGPRENDCVTCNNENHRFMKNSKRKKGICYCYNGFYHDGVN